MNYSGVNVNSRTESQKLRASGRHLLPLERHVPFRE